MNYYKKSEVKVKGKTVSIDIVVTGVDAISIVKVIRYARKRVERMSHLFMGLSKEESSDCGCSGS